jgi:tellurite resistance protein
MWGLPAAIQGHGHKAIAGEHGPALHRIGSSLESSPNDAARERTHTRRRKRARMPAGMTSVASATPLAIRLPARLFAAVMGLAGLSLAWRSAAGILAVPAWIGEALGVLSLVVFLILSAGYVAKLIRTPEAVRSEFDDPVQSSFIATITVSLLLLAGVLRPWAFAVADGVWLAGASLQLLLAVVLSYRWLRQRPDIGQINPGWFIPTIGNIIATITGAALGHIELSWFFFAVGLIFTLILYPVVLYRLIMHETLPPALQPTLWILIVPPALIFLASLALGGSFNGVAQGFFSIALLVAFLLVIRLRQFLALPFTASWWAYTFPLDALAIAALRYHEGLGAGFSLALAVVTLGLATLVLTAVFGLTLRALKEGTLLPAVQPVLNPNAT